MQKSFLQALQGFFQRLIGFEKSAAAAIVKSQQTINDTVSRETAAIEAAVTAELAALRAHAASAMKRIDELVGTNALDSKTAKSVGVIRSAMVSAHQGL